MKNKKRICDIIAIVALIAVIAAVCIDYYIMTKDEARPKTVSEVPVPAVPTVTPTRATGVITEEEWEKYYPNEVRTHRLNAANVGSAEGRVKYTEDTPDIQILYKGMAFSFDYTEAVGHSYTLADIKETTRPHKLANCLTCKTPDFNALVNSEGVGVYARPFDEVYAQVSENVSCYNCHANTPGTIVITHDYMRNAMGSEIEKGNVDPVNVSCAQCHIEYYFDPATKATTAPYTNLQETDPDAILAFYNNMGFVDYTNPNTKVGMIKVQHPEFETYTGRGSVHKDTFNCADCHMGVDFNGRWNAFVDHEFSSPLNNPELVKNNCASCHADLTAKVKEIQKEITTRENEVSALLVEVNQKLAAALEKGTLSKEKADAIRSLDRNAQFYWDFVYVENSEGAHNSALSRECLDKAETIARQALALLSE